MRILIFSIAVGVCGALTEKSEFAATTELAKGHVSTDRQQLENALHPKNSSQLVVLEKIGDEELAKTDKRPRTVVHRDSNVEFRDNCCGNRYTSNGSARPDYNYNKIPLETGRYPSKYAERNPIDRYGWQTQGRPPGPNGNGGRPGTSGVYSASQSGDRYGPRPVYGSESTNRPTALGYGPGGSGYNYGGGGGGYGYGRPTGYGGSSGNGGYGISGTLADGDEFGPSEAAYPSASASQHPTNLHTQKAVALKALAGVALIGAAAALASNPVLLPISIVAGRRKRSESFLEEEEEKEAEGEGKAQTEFEMDYILNMLKENLAKIQRGGSSSRLIISPRCVARLTCEIQKDYLANIGKDVEILNANRKHHLTDLIQSNVLSTNSVNPNVKNLIKLAVGVATESKNCNVFSCNYIRKG